MPHAWESNVIGGVERPEFLLIDETNLVSNGNFETDLSDWSFNAGATDATRIADSDTFYGDYCARIAQKIAGSTATFNADLTFDTGVGSGATLLLMFYAKTESNIVKKFRCIFTDSVANMYDAHYFEVGDEWTLCSVIQENVVGCDDTVTLHFLSTEGSTSRRLDAIRLDNIQVYRVEQRYTLPQPQLWVMNFEKEVYIRNKLIDGTLKEYIHGWRYNLALSYQYLVPLYEKVRTELSEAGVFVVFPHEDSQFCQKVIWDGDYPRKYFKDKFLGHEGVIPMIGQELISKKPTDIVGVGGYAIEEAFGIS